MANKIQIKRSQTNTTVPALSNGELAYTANGAGAAAANQGILYIGGPDGAANIPIGGKFNFGTLTACAALVTNSTSYLDAIKVAQLTVSNISANATFGGAGQALFSNSTGGIFWQAPAGSGTVTNVAPANGIMTQPNPITGAGNVYVVPGGSMVVNSTGVHVNAQSGLIANATGLWVNPGATGGLTANATGVWVAPAGSIAVGATVSVNAGVGTVSNATGHHVLVGATGGLTANTTGVWVSPAGSIAVGATVAVNAGGSIVANATGVHANVTAATSGLVANTTGLWVAVNTSQLVVAAGGITHNATGVVTLQDLTCQGNLTVSGTMITLDATNLTVKDNMIILADQQSVTNSFLDAVDSGFYVTTGNNSIPVYSGLARVASLSTNTNPFLKIFSTNSTVNSTIINATASVGTLQSYLAPWGAGGAFVVNSTAMSLVANSTVSLALTANTLSLATRLAVSNIASGTDGDVFQSNSTAALWGPLDGGTF